MPLYFNAPVVLHTTWIFVGCFVARLRDKIKGTKNGTHKPELVFKEKEISACIEEYLYEQISWKFRI